MRYFTGTPTPYGNLTPEQVKRLQVMIPAEMLYDKFGRLMKQSRQSLVEFLADNAESWTVQEILKQGGN